MKRIYDAAFAVTHLQTGNHPSHIGRYWWIEGGLTGAWTPAEAYDYVSAHPNSVYVSEGTHTIYVVPYHHTHNPTSRWIQTRADGVREDNLVTLAKRHAKGLPNR
jgi:hypothetical protein